ncbi:MAG: hypothetical protein AAGF11_39570 [Myxococcota bacterium]
MERHAPIGSTRNAIDFSEVSNAWVNDVEILNADYGVNIRRPYFVTVRDVVLDTTGDRGNIAGHHGLNNGHGRDNLFIGFDIRTTFQHDLTNEWYGTGVVFTRGRGDDLRMDHHRAAPYATLWTEIDCGAGDSPFVSGGRSDRGPHTAAYDTLWNVRAAQAMSLPSDDFGPRMNFVGFQTDATELTSPYDWWLETIEPDALEPPNLWEAMVERRLGSDDPDTDTGTGTGGDDDSSGSLDDTAGEEGPMDSGTTVVGADQGDGGGSEASSGDTPGADSESDEGCSCHVERNDPRVFGLLGIVLMMAGSRRRRPRADRSA